MWNELSKKEQFETIIYNYDIPHGSTYLPADFDTRGMIHISGEFSFRQIEEIMEAWARYTEEKEGLGGHK